LPAVGDLLVFATPTSIDTGLYQAIIGSTVVHPSLVAGRGPSPGHCRISRHAEPVRTGEQFADLDQHRDGELYDAGFRDIHAYHIHGVCGDGDIGVHQ
jgi:hypothetical protein